MKEKRGKCGAKTYASGYSEMILNMVSTPILTLPLVCMFFLSLTLSVSQMLGVRFKLKISLRKEEKK